MEDSVMSMDYKELRKQCKSKRLSAAGKKTELQKRLIEHLASHTPVIEEEEEMEMSSPVPMNPSITHEKTPTNQVSLVLDDNSREKLLQTYGLDNSFHVKSRTSAVRSARKSLRKSTDKPSEKMEDAPQTPEVVPEPEERREKTPSRLKTPTSFRDHFARIHEKQNKTMESIQDHREKVIKRHQEFTENCPSSIKRLATPKSVKKRQPLRGWTETDPANMTFKFGEEEVDSFEKVVKPKSQTPSSVKRTIKRHQVQMDVKQRTRGSVFTPSTKSTCKKFIDTTKLSDREYELAVEEGLIAGKEKRSTTKRRSYSKKHRDDVLALKRKLNIE